MIPIVVSVDTEEDDWLPSRDVTVENIREIPNFQGRMERSGIRPTYFTTHSVSSRDWASAILREIAARGAAEIAAHLHPWNTPPLDEELTGRNTMTKNLPALLQIRKLECLTARHRDAFDAQPVSFRAGRFGMSEKLVPALIDLGYRVDSSVTPFHSWTEYDDGPDFHDAPRSRYLLSRHCTTLMAPDPDGELIELPVSAGFTRTPFGTWSRMLHFLSAPPLKPLRLVGALSHAGIVRRVLLTPEVASLDDMVNASRCMLEDGAAFLHLFLHSSSLKEGLSPFTRTRADVDRLIGKIEDYAEAMAKHAAVGFATVAEAAGAATTESRTAIAL